MKLRFTDEANPPRLVGKISNFESGNKVDSLTDPKDSQDEASRDCSSFWRSLTYALLAAASDVIDIDRSELDGLFKSVDNNSKHVEIVIYDNIASGAGHSKKVALMFDDVLNRTLELVSSCSCESSCYNCLRTYSNQFFHADLDRHLVRKFLEPIVGELRPDEHQRSFAQHSCYFDIEKFPEMLSQHVSTARQGTAFVLNDLSGYLSLRKLEKAIDSHKASDKPISCVLCTIPTNDGSTQSQWIRRTLAHWVESGYLDLYHYPKSSPELFCFGKDSTSAIAMQVFNVDSHEQRCLVTRSSNGVDQVFSKIQALIGDSAKVSFDDLKDDGIDYKDLNHGDSFSIDELRHKIGIDENLGGKHLLSAHYFDKYFAKQASWYARFFAHLLDGPWLDEDSLITVHTDELHYDDWNRRVDIEQEFKDLPNFRLEWRDKGYQNPKLDHARSLDFTFADHPSLRLIFDKGIDFVQPTNGTKYFVKDKTYVIWKRQ